MAHRLLVFLTTIGIAAAQVDTGTISGLVRDASGAGIPAVNVTVRDELTGLTTGIVTNPTGLYVSPPLRAGTYVVEARAKGFAAAAKRIQLDVSQRFEVDFDLVVGAITETVAVTADRKRHALQSSFGTGSEGPALEQPQFCSVDHTLGRRHARSVANHGKSDNHEARRSGRLDQWNAPGRE